MEFLAELHPKIVHFPIALFIIYTFIEIIGAVFNKEQFTKTAPVLLSLGVLFGVAAVLSGNQAYETGKIIFGLQRQFPRSIVSLHEKYATITLWYFLFLLILRTYFVIKKKLTKTFLIILSALGLVGCYLIYLTGSYGADLVYKFGVGIKLLP